MAFLSSRRISGKVTYYYSYPTLLPTPLLFIMQNPPDWHASSCCEMFCDYGCLNQEGDLANIEKISSFGGYGGADLLLTSNWARGVDVELPEDAYAQLLQLGVSPSVAGEVRLLSRRWWWGAYAIVLTPLPAVIYNLG